MKQFAILGTWLFLSVGLTASAPAYAQATRTWVSGVGDDANPCSRTAPCKTFAGAISKTAAGGEIDALDPGGFGALTITKAITLDGGAGQVASVLTSGTNALVVAAGPNDIVHIRNLELQGVAQTGSPGFAGILFSTGAALHVENVRIYDFLDRCIDFEPSQATNSVLEVNQSILTDCAGGGVLVKPAGGGSAAANLIGVTSSRNLYGLRVEDNGKATVQESSLSANVNNGILAVSNSAPSEINVERSVSSNNVGTGVATAGAAATIRLSQVGIFDNGTGISTASGGQILSFGNNQNAGNGTNGAPSSTLSNQ